MHKRVALYLRVSTKGQSVENQRRELVAVAAQACERIQVPVRAICNAKHDPGEAAGAAFTTSPVFIGSPRVSSAATQRRRCKVKVSQQAHFGCMLRLESRRQKTKTRR